jgi:hypothetical protein
VVLIKNLLLHQAVWQSQKRLLVRATKLDRKQNIEVPSLTCWKIPHKTVDIFCNGCVDEVFWAPVFQVPGSNRKQNISRTDCLMVDIKQEVKTSI